MKCSVVGLTGAEAKLLFKALYPEYTYPWLGFDCVEEEITVDIDTTFRAPVLGYIDRYQRRPAHSLIPKEEIFCNIQP